MSPDVVPGAATTTTLTAANLRQCGRTPPAPVVVRCDNGETLTVRHWLRILPGKRLTGVADWRGTSALVKLFVADAGAERHWRREREGSQRLSARGVPTPALLDAGALAAGGQYVVYEFLPAARPIEVGHAAELEAAFTLLGQLHAQGLVHDDAHFGNFLVADDQLRVVDGDAVRPCESPGDLIANLALLHAQLPMTGAGVSREQLLEAYRRGHPASRIDRQTLDSAIAGARDRRVAKYLEKCTRDCTQFRVERCATRFVAMIRDEAECLAPLLAEPDAWMRNGRPLKSGHTATVALVDHAGRAFVIKRYNIKGFSHALSRCWRPSRAWHAWREGHRLRALGIPTPRPLALIERRFGPLRGVAWLITEFNPGENLADWLGTPRSPEVLAPIGELFAALVEARISHGDLKAKNLLWTAGTPYLIDLDSMRQHRTDSGFRHAWRKDRARFLRNWPPGSEQHQVLEALMPAA